MLKIQYNVIRQIVIQNILTPRKIYVIIIEKQHGDKKMNFNQAKFKEFTLDEAEEWGRKNYVDWLPELQSQDYEPQTPAEEFFRYYTQGIHNFFNETTRYDETDTFYFDERYFSKEMFDDSIKEINCHPIPDDIVVYRYVPKTLIKKMLEWGDSKSLKRNSILVDKGFFSTTLNIGAVKSRGYAELRKHSLFKIYVPKGTPSVYVDLISDMHEQEMLFAPGIKLKVIWKCWFGKFVECIVC